MSGLSATAPDVAADIHQIQLCNDDLAPVPQWRRNLGMLSFAPMWISMSACITTSIHASLHIGSGMNLRMA